MTREESLVELKNHLKSLGRYKDKKLIERQEWGDINFKDVEKDIQSVLYLATALLDLPLEHLSEKIISNISILIPSVVEQLNRIDEFSTVTEADSESVKDEICNRLINEAYQLQDSTNNLVPYLAFRSGDYNKKFKSLDEFHKKMEEGHYRTKEWMDEKKQEVDNDISAYRLTTKNWMDEKKQEVDNVIAAYRLATASAGVAIFTKEFEDEAKNLLDRSKKWLRISILLVVITIGTAIAFYFCLKVPDSAKLWEGLNIVISKAAVIGILFAGTVWCSRIYRALIHQSAVNKHRSLSLKTFRAFVKATGDPYIKDAVLMAATRTVFTSVSTGFVNQTSEGQDSGVNFVEFGRTMKDNLDQMTTVQQG